MSAECTVYYSYSSGVVVVVVVVFAGNSLLLLPPLLLLLVEPSLISPRHVSVRDCHASTPQAMSSSKVTSNVREDIKLFGMYIDKEKCG